MSTSIANGTLNGHLEELDVAVVGMGFGGVYVLHHLRKLGYKVKGFESGGFLGGVWWHNSYPGARVDTSSPFYEFSDEAIWKDWNWSEKFPGREELQEYFKTVDRVWDISKDVQFNTTVTKTGFDTAQNKWNIYTDKGNTVKARFLLLATGFAAKLYVPYMKGLDTFEGTAFHTSMWPKEKDAVDFRGKRVGVIGTGATGVQVIQELGPLAGHLTVFQRTPNQAMPMRQANVDRETEQVRKKQHYPDLMTLRRNTLAGWDYSPSEKKTFDVSAEERTARWEALWEDGGFKPWLGNYSDIIQNEEANLLMYQFWRDKVRERIDTPELKEALAPQDPIHPFGTKRPSLEQRYFEVYNQSNVELVNLRSDPIVEVTSNSVRTAKKEYSLDILVLATGFDAGIISTGSLTKIDIRGVDGITLKEKWKASTATQLGMSAVGFPNLLFMYGPQSPCAFAIGPVNAEIQGDWIIACIENMKLRNQTRIEALPEAEAAWTKINNDLANATLLPKADSWYNGANIPGKPREFMNYIGGLPAYTKALNESSENGYAGFNVS